MGLGDFVSDVGGGIVRGVRAVGGEVVDGTGAVVDGAGRVVREVAGVFDIGEPSGSDHGSSNWAAWGHHEIRSMLDDTVSEGDIQEAAQAWRVQRERDVEIIASLTRDLSGIIANGWGGESGREAVGALEPVNQWSATFAEAAQSTGDLMEHSGSSAGHAKATVPPAIDYDFRRTGISLVSGGVFGAGADAIAQDHAQEEARREAVRIMKDVYSAPINENRAAVPSYPQPVDPTLRPPEPFPVSGPTPGAGLSRGGSGIPGGGGGVPGGVPYQPPAAAGLQSAGVGSVDGGQFGPSPGAPQTGGGGQGYGGTGYGGHGGGGQGMGAAAAAMPFMPPMAGGSEQERARRGFRGAGPPGGRAGGGGGYLGGGRGGVGGYPGGGGDFGPRGSSPSPAAAGEGRAGMGAGGAAGGRGGGVPGGVPVGGAGGRGQGGEDTEHQRPSYLIEMNDIFNDGRKVAPPVIGVDPPEYHD